MITNRDIIFLRWFANRLVYRYGLNQQDPNLNHFYKIIDSLTEPSISIDNNDLDKILSKYYADFFLDKSENLGFNDDERCKLRSQILSLVQDIVNRNIPTEDILIS